jgi:hypothetical protein
VEHGVLGDEATILSSPLRAGRSHAVVAGLAGACFAAVFARVLWHLGDEGSIVDGARRWSEGQVPYRDFFEVMGPAAFVPTAIAFRIFGVSWWPSRVPMIATVGMTAAFLAYFAGRFRRAGEHDRFLVSMTYIAAAVPLWPGQNFHLDSNAGFLGAVALGTAGGSKCLTWRAVVAGFLTSCVALTMVQKGGVLAAGLCLAFLLDRTTSWRARAAAVAAFLLTILTAVSAAAYYFASHRALAQLAYATVIWPMTQYHTVNRVPVGHGMEEIHRHMYELWGSALPWPAGSLVALWAVAPVIITLTLAIVGFAALARAASGADGRWRHVTSLAMGVGLMISESHRPDIMHLLYGAPLLMVAGHDTLQEWLARRHRSLQLVMPAAMAPALVAALVVPLTAQTVVSTRVGSLHLLARDPAIDYLTQHTSPGERVFIYPYVPMYYFVGGVANPTKYSIFMYGINTDEQAQEIVDALENQQVRVVMWDAVYSGAGLSRWFNYRPPPVEQQVIERYLQARFRVDGVAGNFRILLRRSAEGTTEASVGRDDARAGSRPNQQELYSRAGRSRN